MVRFTSEMKSSGFELIPEGVTILKVTELKANATAGKVKDYRATMVDSAGRKIFNTYNVNPNNKYYMQAMRSFYSLLKTGCALTEVDGEIDENQAVGRYIIAKIKHTEGNDGRTFQNLGYIIGNASGFDDDISEYVEREAERDARVAQSNRVSAPVAEVEEDPYA